MGFTLNQLEQERQIKKLQKKEDKDTKDYEKLDNLPSINSVELKGNKTTSDLGINADNVMMSDGVTSVVDAVDGVKSDLTSVTTINKQVIYNFAILKVGHVVMLSMIDGTLSTDSEGFVLQSGSRFILPSGYRPISTVNTLESYAKKRVSIDVVGRISLPEDLSATSLVIRFAVVYLVN